MGKRRKGFTYQDIGESILKILGDFENEPILRGVCITDENLCDMACGGVEDCHPRAYETALQTLVKAGYIRRRKRAGHGVWTLTDKWRGE